MRQALVFLAVVLGLGCSGDNPAVTDSSTDLGGGSDAVTDGPQDTPDTADTPTDQAPVCPPGESVCGDRCVDTRTNPAHCGACGMPCPTGQQCTEGACRPLCEMGQTGCMVAGSTRCVNTATDSAHCGACGTACPMGEACAAGRCGVSCGEGQRACGGRCVDTASDAAHCGMCGNVCPSGQSCVRGACAVTCTEGQTPCMGRCADTRTDTSHCGMCGAACATGEGCAAGRCALTCPPGQTPCMGRCADTANDTSHCGACGRACAAGEDCAAGACVPRCGAGQTLCMGAMGPACATTASDPVHCGRCGSACPAGERCSEGACRATCAAGTTACMGAGGATACADVRADPAHCGACGNRCAMGQSCVAGACRLVCPMGERECSGRCVDPLADSAHCGACGNACPTGRSCVAGACAVVCPTGQSECSGRCVDPQTDAAHCGRCGGACAAGQSCVRGACALVCPTGQVACGGACVDTRTSASHCGACGTACAAGQACVAGACAVVCPTGQTECSGRCVDTRADGAHCGRCGNACGATERCGSGTCVPLCAAPTTPCVVGGATTCVDTGADPAHCGACGMACGMGLSCVSGRCMLVCPTGQTACAGRCVDTQSDSAHCGACGMVCPASVRCDRGVCQVFAPRAVATAAPVRLVRDDAFRTVVTLDGRGSTGGALTYQWTIPDGRLEAGSALTDPLVRVRFAGTADHAWTLRVTNPRGEDAASGTVRINRPPVANPGMGGVFPLGAPIALDASRSADMDGDPLTYRWSLTTRPMGSSATLATPTMVMAAFTPDAAGTYVATLVVNDGLEDSAPATVSLLTASNDLDPPRVTLMVTPSQGAVGTVFRVCVAATDASGIAARTLTVDGAPVTLDASFCGSYTGSAVGRHDLRATARDAAGNTGDALGALYVRAAADNGAPRVSITAPAPAAVLSADTTVTGSVTDTDLVSYWLEAAATGTTDYRMFARGTSPVTAGALGVLQRGAFRAGVYTLRLCADDTWGNRACTAGQTVDIPEAAPRSGLVRMGFLDAQFDLLGLPINVRRVYDSRFPTSSDFGYGWSLELENSARVTQLGVASEGWADTGCGRFPFRASISETIAPHRWTVTIGSQTFRFRMTVTGTACGTGFAEVSVGFAPESGTLGTFVPIGVPTTNLWLVDGGPRGPTIVLPDFDVWDATRFRLTRPDGVAYELRTGVGVTAITDAGGNRITISATGITHSGGTGLTLTRDGSNRITTLVSPLGRRTYRYNTPGDLVASVDPTGSETRYRYDSAHLLLEVTDPRGMTPGRLEYDALGRVTAVVDSTGRRVELRDEPGNRSVYTDRTGATRVVTYDAAGNIASRVDPLGNTTRYTYDSAGRLTSETDPLGNVSRLEYDSAGRPTALVDPMGRRTVNTYDASGRNIAITDPLGNVRRLEYGSNGAVSAAVNARGGRTTYTTTASGAVTAITDPAGVRVNMTRDSSGRLTGYTDGAGRTGTVTMASNGAVASETFRFGGRDVSYRYTYDSAGRITGQTLPSGGTSTIRYDSAGNPEQAINALGGMQSMVRDSRDQVSALRNPDGTAYTFARDAEDRITQVTLSDGTVLRRELDAAGRPVRVTLPAGDVVTTAYDAAGRVASRTRAGEGTTRFTYDANGHATAVTAPNGGVTRHEYDAGGRNIATTDPLGNRVQVTYDADGNVTSTRQADGALATITRDLSGRVTQLTSERGATLRYTRNAAGETTAVTDPAGGSWSFTHDEAGVLGSATTPTGNVWRYTRDASGRLLSRQFPWGGTEAFTRDVEGRVTRVTDAAGVTLDIERDALGRVTARLPAAPSEAERRTYTAAGQLASVRGPFGTVTYTRDAAGRVASVGYTGGASVQYTYDAAGRRASVRTASGTTSYEYDPVTGWLSAVVDSVAGRTAYAYDLAGRLSTVTHADGAVTSYTRDPRGNVTRERAVTRGGATLRDVTYTRDPGGNVLSAVEASGRSVVYTYDTAGRVTREARSGGSDAATVDYAYDGDGSLTRVGARTLAVTNLRLTNDGTWTYTYDASGRVTGRARGGVTEAWRYDAFGRLVELTRTGATPARVQLTYNQNDLLQRVVTDGVGRTLYWDDEAQVPLLLEERDDAGALLVRYVYGHGVLAQTASSGVRVLHRDALGHTRLVTDGAGAEVARYAFSAYGEGTEGATDGASRMRFSGEYLVPELGLYFLRARFYDATTGRFITPDSLPQNTEDLSGFNPYHFAGGDPVNYRDPTGQMSLGSMTVTIGIINVLASIALPFFGNVIERIARAWGFEAPVELVGFNFSVQFTKNLLSAGLQLDVVRGPRSVMAILWVFFGVQLGEGRSSDPRLFANTKPITFAAGPIFSTSEDANADPKVEDVHAGIYVSITGSLAQRLIEGVSRARNARTNVVSYSRAGLQIQWEAIGVQSNGQLATFHPLKFSLGLSDLGTSFPVEFAGIKNKFVDARSPRGGRAASIAFQVYLPLLWGQLSWDASGNPTFNGSSVVNYFDELYADVL
ncbi:MAG: PKD domain-containing protein [Deltaproteobacteria bacterium]|nr:PKD domain-containing protein [Deltaproteobacteria bacterium]